MTLSLAGEGTRNWGQESYSFHQPGTSLGYGHAPVLSCSGDNGLRGRCCIPRDQRPAEPPGSFPQGQASPGPRPAGPPPAFLPVPRAGGWVCGRVRLRTRAPGPPAPRSTPALCPHGRTRYPAWTRCWRSPEAAEFLYAVMEYFPTRASDTPPGGPAGGPGCPLCGPLGGRPAGPRRPRT